MSDENVGVKRDLAQREKRPSTEGKETYVCVAGRGVLDENVRVKRDLVQREKRPSTEGKETYVCVTTCHGPCVCVLSV